MSDETKQIEKATLTAHWPGKSVNVCGSHAEHLEGIASVMGFALITTPFDGDERCINCVNAAKKSKT
jgi:hypothetical protein